VRQTVLSSAASLFCSVRPVTPLGNWGVRRTGTGSPPGALIAPAAPGAWLDGMPPAQQQQQQQQQQHPAASLLTWRAISGEGAASATASPAAPLQSPAARQLHWRDTSACAATSAWDAHMQQPLQGWDKPSHAAGNSGGGDIDRRASVAGDSWRQVADLALAEPLQLRIGGEALFGAGQQPQDHHEVRLPCCSQ
jgi:hypothetical protein